MIKIRTSTPLDITPITAIYSHHVLHGTGTVEVTPPSEHDMSARRDDVISKNLPYLVMEDGAKVVGFAYCNLFKPRPAYRFSAEDSIYLEPHTHARGLGRMLLSELMAQAERAGVRKLIAVIGDSANAGSVGVHHSCGFSHVGTLANCGWKFNRWLDVVLMEKSLGMGSSSNPAAT